jgi:membrane complex biogenesis BtpA family protein
VKFQCVKGKERKCYKKLKTIKINYVKRCLISLSVITSKFTTHEMLKFGGLFGKVRCAVIGMVHVGALPGTPRSSNSVNELVSKACKEAETYLKHDIDSILVENMHDVPYVQSRHFSPETVAVMTRICSEIKRIVPGDLPCGVQVLATGNKEALAVAQACSFHFIRAEGFVFGHVADEGFTDANAGVTLRYRKNIHADNLLVFADIKKKHRFTVQNIPCTLLCGSVAVRTPSRVTFL